MLLTRARRPEEAALHFQEARDAFSLAHHMDPADPAAKRNYEGILRVWEVNRANTAYESGDLETAAWHLLGAVEHPALRQDDYAWMLLARIRNRQERFEDGLDAAIEATVRFPRGREALAERAYARAALGDHRGAAEDYRVALAGAPTSVLEPRLANDASRVLASAESTRDERPAAERIDAVLEGEVPGRIPQRAALRLVAQRFPDEYAERFAPDLVRVQDPSVPEVERALLLEQLSLAAPAGTVDAAFESSARTARRLRSWTRPRAPSAHWTVPAWWPRSPRRHRPGAPRALPRRGVDLRPPGGGCSDRAARPPRPRGAPARADRAVRPGGGRGSRTGHPGARGLRLTELHGRGGTHPLLVGAGARRVPVPELRIPLRTARSVFVRPGFRPLREPVRSLGADPGPQKLGRAARVRIPSSVSGTKDTGKSRRAPSPIRPHGRDVRPQPTREVPRDHMHAILETDRGTITVRLHRKDAPNTVENFVKLARKRFYDGTSCTVSSTAS